MFRTLSTLCLLIAATVMGGCAPLLTQSPGKGLSPVNAVSEGEDRHLMLFGHDVVSYFTENTHRRGSPTIKSVYKDVTFRFSKPEHKAMFDREPEKYIPQYGGYCANGIVYAIPWGGDADSWLVRDGKLYIFGGKGSRDGFLLDVPKNIALADKYWKEEVNGSNAFFKRTWRTTLGKVPHYKTGAQIAEEVARAKK
ncbi:MAG: YHS domain-containing (seleno)protein [Burkholderiales bacterium]